MSDLSLTPITYRPLLNVDRDDIQYQPRPGAYALIFNASNELLVLEEETGFFLPGGGQDPGETITATLAREIQEELQGEVVSYEYLLAADDSRWSPFYQRHFQIQGHYFLTRLKSMEDLKPEPESRIHWFAIGQAAEQLTRHNERWQLNQFIGPVQRWSVHQPNAALENILAQANQDEALLINEFSHEPITADLSPVEFEQDERLFVALQQDTVIGVISIQPKQNTIQICRLAVARNYRHQGIARSLVQYVIDLFPQLHLSVLTAENNQPAQSLYQSLGFRPVSGFAKTDATNQVSYRVLERVG